MPLIIFDPLCFHPLWYFEEVSLVTSWSSRSEGALCAHCRFSLHWTAVYQNVHTKLFFSCTGICTPWRTRTRLHLYPKGDQQHTLLLSTTLGKMYTHWVFFSFVFPFSLILSYFCFTIRLTRIPVYSIYEMNCAKPHTLRNKYKPLVVSYDPAFLCRVVCFLITIRTKILTVWQLSGQNRACVFRMILHVTNLSTAYWGSFRMTMPAFSMVPKRLASR